jgi:deazaflavin-dependent oxidoreductase (nitroreductase family)
MNAWNKQMIAAYHARGGKNLPNFGDNLLLLHTVGAKSGQSRLNPLAFTRDGDKIVVIASKGGAPTNPDWYHNVIANGTVTVEAGGEKFPVRATEVKGAERDRLYAKHAERFPGFIEYQQKTTRKIPVLTLERVST